jgi:hypothetical protein
MRDNNASDRPQAFLILFHHPARGPLLGSITVSKSGQSTWTTRWDVGTIDKDPELSDHWFCQDRYERQFTKLLQWAAGQVNSASFEIPCATLRWGSAKGIGKELALGLANHLDTKWEEILADWEARPA